MEELERGLRPTLQYNETFKTTGLAYVISPDQNVTPRLSKKSFAQIATEVAQTHSERPSIDYATKKQKTGIICKADIHPLIY